jgi:SAM-dependent methyltransferase
MASILGKIAQTLRFLRYGPTELAQLRMLEDNVRDLSNGLRTKAEDAHLRHARDSLAADIRRETDWLRDQLTALGGAIDALGARAQATGAATVSTPSQEAAESAFYLALERQFRGTREELRQRLQVYQPWIAQLPEGPVADLGCGRGEWLELLREWGRRPLGVDLNPLHVQQVREQGFEAECMDALQWLRAQKDESLAAITSFHVVEHLPFGVLLQLVDQARRVLVPGGRLILETPNPENLGVATQSFWLDPTHLRPLPPPLLEFVCAHAGLPVDATLRLSPPAAPAQPIQEQALKALLMEGRDYAVIARKAPGGPNA